MKALWSRWWRSIAIGAFLELVALGGTVLSPNTHRGRPVDGLAAGLVIVAAAMAVIARRWPLAALAVSLAGTAAYFGFGYAIDTSFFIGLLVTAYRSASADGRGRGAAFVVAAVVAFAAGALAPANRNGSDWLWIASIVVAAQLAGQVAAELGARSQRQAEEAREEEARRRLAEERLKIARELHDVVSHSMAVINVQAGVAAHVLDRNPEQAREALVAIRTASHTAMRDLRSILGLMRNSGEPEPLDPTPGLSEVPALVERVRRSGVDVRLEMDAVADRVSPGAALTAYRVIQEALTNIVRHAPGAGADVSVRVTPEAIVVDVENDAGGSGGGLAEAGTGPGAGHGLEGMRERVRAAGGSVEAGPRAGGGFRVHAILPADGT